MMQFCDLSLQLLNLRLEASDLMRQAINLSLLSSRLLNPTQCWPAEGLREQLKEGVRPTSIGLIDLPVHGIGQAAGHHLRT
jgi:hypothetical protein